MAKIKLDPKQIDQAVKEFIMNKFNLEAVLPLKYIVNISNETVMVEAEVKSLEKF